MEPPVGFQRVDALQGIYQSVMSRTPGTTPFRDRLDPCIQAMQEWTAKAKAALKSTESLVQSPAYPAERVPFSGNAGTYSEKQLRVYVKQTK